MDMIRPESGTGKFSRMRGQGDMQSITVTQPLAESPPANQACWLPTLVAHSTLCLCVCVCVCVCVYIYVYVCKCVLKWRHFQS